MPLRVMSSVGLDVTDAIKKHIDFDWIRSAACSLQLPRNRGWNCEMHQKDFSQSMNEASRQKAIKWKLQILSHKRMSIISGSGHSDIQVAQVCSIQHEYNFGRLFKNCYGKYYCKHTIFVILASIHSYGCMYWGRY
jgi:hypothetical protein